MARIRGFGRVIRSLLLFLAAVILMTLYLLRLQDNEIARAAGIATTVAGFFVVIGGFVALLQLDAAKRSLNVQATMSLAQIWLSEEMWRDLRAVSVMLDLGSDVARIAYVAENADARTALRKIADFLELALMQATMKQIDREVIDRLFGDFARLFFRICEVPVIQPLRQQTGNERVYGHLEAYARGR